ncbi:hypothetical protein [Mycolicibacterium bacteremicum]|uniref:hypothetical protein n=1 Tax=Mycolicibacterium bacteremicum TaxID=564198 RepID=UPI001F453874|nr:hypothetical protein [Mycolicibacterium bacteremicum]
MTTELAVVLADSSNPGRVIGTVIGRLLILALIIWGIVYLIRKSRRPKQFAPYPPQQPYWDGTGWRYPQQGPQPQPYWDGAAWQYPQQPYPQQYSQQPYPQPPHPGQPGPSWPAPQPPYPPAGPGSQH